MRARVRMCVIHVLCLGVIILIQSPSSTTEETKPMLRPAVNNSVCACFKRSGLKSQPKEACPVPEKGPGFRLLFLCAISFVCCVGFLLECRKWGFKRWGFKEIRGNLRKKAFFLGYPRIFQVLFRPSGKGRKRQKKGRKGRFRLLSGKGGQTPLKPPFVTPICGNPILHLHAASVEGTTSDTECYF